MRPHQCQPCIEILEGRLLLRGPWDAPPLGDPPPPGKGAVWVDTEPALRTAVENLQSGQTIVIRPGTYHLTRTLFIGLSRPVQNVTIRGATENFDDVVLKGRGMENPDFGNVRSLIAVYDAQNVLIANLAAGDVYEHPIMLQGGAGAGRVHVYHTHLFDAGTQFVKSNPGLGFGVTDTVVEYNLMDYSNGPPTTDHGGGTGYGTKGVDAHYISDWVIRHNLFRGFHTPDWVYHLWNPTVQVRAPSRNITVEGNTFIDCDRAVAFGIYFDAIEGGVIRNNFIYQTPGLFSEWRHLGSDAQIIVWDTRNAAVYHNTILTNHNSKNAVDARWDTAGLQIRNNLADAPLRTREGGSFTASGNYLEATPDMFADAVNGDLHLVLNDATLAYVIDQAERLKDAAQDWDDGERRDVTDIGADEYQFKAAPGVFPPLAKGVADVVSAALASRTPGQRLGARSAVYVGLRQEGAEEGEPWKAAEDGEMSIP